MIIAGTGVTKPDAGVMATSPATAPEANPRVVGFFRMIFSQIIHERAAVPVAIWVAKKAYAAVPLAAAALPALKPNQPNHRIPAPSMVMVRL